MCKSTTKCCLDHLILPCICTRTVEVILERIPLAFGKLSVPVSPDGTVQILSNGGSSPSSRDDIVLDILLVQHADVQCLIALPDEVVQHDGSFNEQAECVLFLSHLAKEALETQSQNTEGVFNNTPCPGQPVVEDLLLLVKVKKAIGFHHVRSHGEGIISHERVRHRVVVIIMG